MGINNLMTVCIGNICRSPVAEGLFRKELPGCQVWSSGLAAVVGSPADQIAQEIALSVGIDISLHRAQQVQGWMCVKADLILVMETSHQRELERRFPLARGKIRRLGEFDLNSAGDIADPYRKNRSAFEIAHHSIAQGVIEWGRRIRLIA